LSSIIPELDEANPVTRRAAVAMRYMLAKGGNASSAHSAAMRIVGKICAEAIQDASEVPPAIAEFYMTQLSAIMFWVATGERRDDAVLPEDFDIE
jgi:hypothetical protein